MFILKYDDFIRDPIHKYIEITPLERRIIDTPVLQRLRYIKQTASLNFVYPGATHTRFEHSLGVMHIGGMWIEHLLRDEYINVGSQERRLIKKQIQKVRIAGLLHDIGHGPLSHVFEYYFLFELDEDKKNDHEKIGLRIIDEILKPKLLSEGEEVKFDANDIEDIKVMIKGENSKPDNKYLYQIIANKNSIDADKLDFLLRDSYYCGAEELGRIDAQRLILNSQLSDERIIVHNKKNYYTHQHFWLARAHMYRNVYFHRASIAHDILFGSLLRQVEKEYKIAQRLDDLSYYLTLTDTTFLEICRKNPNINTIIKKLYCRDIPKVIFERELNVEYQAIANILNERKREILDAIKKDVLCAGFESTIADNLYFEVSSINIPISISENAWVDEKGTLQKLNPTSFLDLFSSIFVVFIRIYLWEDVDESKKDELSRISRDSLSAWMKAKGLSKGKGLPKLNL